MRRVAVTGVGLVTALGADAQTSFAALVAGTSGVARLAAYDPTGEKVAVGAEVKPSVAQALAEALPSEARERSSRFVHFAIGAAREALAMSGNPHREHGDDFGVFTGVGYGKVLPADGYKVGPTTIIQSMPNGAAAWLAILEGLRGPTLACSTACASGAHAIGVAFDQVRLGRVKGMVAGGVDTVVARDVMRSFAWLRALNTAKDEEPTRMSRPFDRTRRGFVMGEGAGFLVLEDYEFARARGARVLAEMRGWGASTDAHHIVAVAPGGVGMAMAMQRAIDDGTVPKDTVDYISAHGTSTPMNDKEETKAIRTVFEAHAERLMVSSQKSMIGHAMGGAGAIEAVVTVMSVDQQVATPTINLREADPECDLDYVPNEARHRPLRVALNNSFGFGGHNTSLVFSHPEAL